MPRPLRFDRAGGSRGYFELLELANLHNPFKPGTVELAVKAVTDALDSGRF